jgi:uroporphyrinogen decarboxylase
MTAKELIHNVIALQPVDRVPAALLLGGSWALNTRKIPFETALRSPAEEIADVIVAAYRSIDTDIVWAAPGSGNLIIQALGGKLKFRPSGPPDVVEAVIKNIDSIEAIDIEKFKRDPMLLRVMEITKRIIDKAAPYFALGGSMWGPLTLAGLLYGTEHLMRDIRKNKDAVHTILDWTARLYLAYVEDYIKNGIDLITMGEPTASGDMISRTHFAEFVVPVLKKIYTSLAGRGIKTCLHICGNIENCLDLIAETGVDIVSLDYKVSLKKAQKSFGGKIAFAGNINPVDILQHGTREEIQQTGSQCIVDAGTVGFILMPGCDIPPSTPAENIKTMTDVAHSFS